MAPTDPAWLARLRQFGISPAILAIGAAWVALVGVLAYLSSRGVSVPSTCAFKNLTGKPCATCGSTRAFVKLLHADVLGALSLNPLMTVIMLALPLWLAWRIARPSTTHAPPTSARYTTISLVLVILIALNWAYVIWRGV